MIKKGDSVKVISLCSLRGEVGIVERADKFAALVRFSDQSYWVPNGELSANIPTIDVDLGFLQKQQELINQKIDRDELTDLENALIDGLNQFLSELTELHVGQSAVLETTIESFEDADNSACCCGDG